MFFQAYIFTKNNILPQVFLTSFKKSSFTESQNMPQIWFNFNLYLLC